MPLAKACIYFAHEKFEKYCSNYVGRTHMKMQDGQYRPSRLENAVVTTVQTNIRGAEEFCFKQIASPAHSRLWKLIKAIKVIERAYKELQEI